MTNKDFCLEDKSITGQMTGRKYIYEDEVKTAIKLLKEKIIHKELEDGWLHPLVDWTYIEEIFGGLADD